MKKISFILFLLLPFVLHAQNWDDIQHSGKYYYGVGQGKTREEAIQQAMAELTGMIATNVSNEFQGIESETTVNGEIDHKSKVLSCVKTYSQATLTNVEKWVVQEAPDIVVRCYILRSEMERIYQTRIDKALDMMQTAEEALKRRKVDMALQYYYWAYSLIRSTQRPNEVKDTEGHILMNWLPTKIENIMGDISVTFDHRDGDFVDLLFTYQGEPVGSLSYTYSDGRAECQGEAKDGRGMIEMIPSYETDTYHLSIEYEFMGQARGDNEMQSVLDVVTKKTFGHSDIHVNGKKDTTQNTQSTPTVKTGVNLNPTKTQVVENESQYAEILAKVMDAIAGRNYSSAMRYFTPEGLETYNKLISYGTGRLVGSPNVKYFRGIGGTVVARGVQMSFSFRSGTKKTFVEDVAFTFDADMKISNVAFGLGQVAENDILCKYAPGWKDETREMLMEFLENYKTAYCLKRYDYIRDIFADDATIIIGNVTKRRTTPNHQERGISIEGQNTITYNRYTKDQYLANLRRCFQRNEFINLRFSNNDIQWLEKYQNEEIFAIQIGQEYNSSSYADMGYLFLLVDMTDHESPQIKIRTWQPNEVDIKKIYNAGDFYNE